MGLYTLLKYGFLDTYNWYISGQSPVVIKWWNISICWLYRCVIKFGGDSGRNGHVGHVSLKTEGTVYKVGPPLTKLRSVGANNSNFTMVSMVYGTYNYSIHGVYKPSYS